MREWAIWSNEHRAFWRQNRHGYVSSLAEAGRFLLAEAQAICDDASHGGKLMFRSEGGRDMPPEIMILAPIRRARLEPVVVAALAVAEFCEGKDFPEAERLLRVITETIRHDREQAP